MKTVLRGLFPSVEITNDDESVSWSSNVSGLSLPLCLVINIDQLALFFGGGGLCGTAVFMSHMGYESTATKT